MFWMKKRDSLAKCTAELAIITSDNMLREGTFTDARFELLLQRIRKLEARVDALVGADAQAVR